MSSYASQQGMTLTEACALVVGILRHPTTTEVHRFLAADGWEVSTVWLGLDHSHTFEGPPVIFETMIFAPKDVTIGRGDWEAGGDASGTVPDLDQFQDRYATEQAAQAGHDRALAAMVDQLGAPAAMDVMSAAQFSDPVAVPDDLSGIE